MRAIVLVGLTALGLGTAWAAEEAKLDEAQAVGVLLTANANEVPMATAIAARSADPEIRAYAMELLQTHAQANHDLLTMLGQRDLRARDSELREEVAEDGQKGLEAYWAKDVGASLDQRFVTDAIVQHRELLEHFDEVLIPAATTPAVRAQFTGQRAAVARHLQEACTIGMRVEAQTAGCPVAEPGTR